MGNLYIYIYLMIAPFLYSCILILAFSINPFADPSSYKYEIKRNFSKGLKKVVTIAYIIAGSILLIGMVEQLIFGIS